MKTKQLTDAEIKAIKEINDKKQSVIKSGKIIKK
jgi:hypothetical protein